MTLELLGGLIFGLGFGYILGRFPWTFALSGIAIGLALMTAPSDGAALSFGWATVGGFPGGTIGTWLGMDHRDKKEVVLRFRNLRNIDIRDNR